MEYPETKRYPELYERFNKNSVCFGENLFYVFSSGDIVYTDGADWYVRRNDGAWEKDYEAERRAIDAAYGIAEVPAETAEEYGFKAPFKDADIQIIPYAALFYMVYCSCMERYRGIWQDWLCMTAEKGEVPEPWTVCLAEEDFHGLADDLFCARYEQEREFLSYGAEDFVPGFVWKMYAEKNITADETFSPLEKCGFEDEADVLRSLTEDGEDGEDSAFDIYGSYLFDRDIKIFEKEIWDKLPGDVRELFLLR